MCSVKANVFRTPRCQGKCLWDTVCHVKGCLNYVSRGIYLPEEQCQGKCLANAVCHGEGRPNYASRGIAFRIRSVKANVFQTLCVTARIFQTQSVNANVFQLQDVNIRKKKFLMDASAASGRTRCYGRTSARY